MNADKTDERSTMEFSEDLEKRLPVEVKRVSFSEAARYRRLQHSYRRCTCSNFERQFNKENVLEDGNSREILPGRDGLVRAAHGTSTEA